MIGYFWEIADIDTGDLAAAVAGDLCEGNINPRYYLSAADDFKRLNYIRWCMAIGFSGERLVRMSLCQLEKLFKDECLYQFGAEISGDLEQQIVLGTLFRHFGGGIGTDYYISHDTMKGDYPSERRELVKKLKRHFGVEKFTTKERFYFESEHAFDHLHRLIHSGGVC